MSVPLWTGGERTRLLIDAAADLPALYWRVIQATTAARARIPQQFSGRSGRQHRQEFDAFVWQGCAFWDAARRTAGPARALLYYYAILQLAKAEVLLTRPNDVFGTPVHHGLKAVGLKSARLRDGQFQRPKYAQASSRVWRFAV